MSLKSLISTGTKVWLDSIETAAASGLGDYAGLRRASRTRLCATTADQMRQVMRVWRR